ncbi:MAG: GEVED domain-containing protein [Salinivirgaceae bacterium]
MEQNYFMKKLGFTALIVWLFIQAAFAQTPPSDLSGADLRAWLKVNYYDGKHTTLGYTNARVKMYNYIDNQNNTITCVYSGYEKSWTYGGTGSNPDPINCEHTVPQSFFNEAEPMKSDIHHLFPTYMNWNSTRSNYPFAEIDDNATTKWMYLTTSTTSIPSSNIDLYSEYASSTFEPREDHKGDVARAIFYFYTMYPTQAGAIGAVADINELYDWHLADPVSQKEIDRNLAIETHQGDKNPYIVMPSLVAKAWGFSGTEPTVPATPSLALTVASTSLNLSWTNVADESGYRIYRSVNGGSYALLNSPGANVTSYSDANVSTGSTYTYYILAYNVQGNSPNSNTVSGQLSTTGGSDYAADLILSEYVEGSSNNKALELANFTGSTVSLSNYSIFKQTNGAGSWASELVLSGTLNHGDAYVIVYASAGSTLLAKADLTTTSQALTFNGNDPVALFKNGQLIDVIGTFNSTAVFATDKTLVRNASVTAPNTSYVASEWTDTGLDNFTDLGTHTMDLEGGPVADTQAPTAPASLVSSNVTSTSVLLSWNASTDNVGVTGYQVFRNGTQIQTVTSTSYTVSGLSAATSYAFTVKATDAAGNVSGASNTVNVTTPAEAVVYCASKGSNATYEWIAGVKLGTFTKTSGGAGYTDFTTTQINLTSGQSYALTLTPGFSGSTYQEYWKIWIDYNKNGVFDTDELAFDAGSLSSSAVSGNLTLPISATGTTRMRVSMKYNGAQTACETFSYGEVEDYTVVISQGVADTQAPTAPSQLLASNTTTTGTSLAWNASTDNVGVAGYYVYKNGLQIQQTSGTSLSVSGLSAGTSYSFTVKAFDAAGNLSASSNTASVTTLPQSISYCASKGSNSSYEWIDLVQLGNMTSATGNNGGYADFTDKIATIAYGSNTIYYSAGFSSSSYVEYWHVWIDYNHDGIFGDTERVAYGSSSSAATLSSTFTVPTSALSGPTRMRVTMKYNGAGTACETFSYGEVEDYMVNIVDQASNLVMAVNTESVQEETAYDVEVFPNPASTYLKVKFSSERNVDFTITDITGRTVFADNLVTNNQTIDLNRFENGVYLLTLNMEGKMLTTRFIKQ